MSVEPSSVLRLRSDDNICLATQALSEGQVVQVDGREIQLRAAVPFGHKITLEAVAEGQAIRKYGQIIGFATENIAAGDWVHSHNLSAGKFERDYAFCQEIPPAPTPITDRVFQGYRRENGRAGTRNYVAVISSVNCSASVSKYICSRFDESLLRDFPNIDGVLPITHQGGCAMQFGGEDHDQLNRVLAGFARHPNVAAYMLVGLGCETGSIRRLIEDQGLVQLGAEPSRPPRVLNMQDLGGTGKTVEEGVRVLAEMLPAANDVRRESIPASELILGLECGGSDGNSGVTANPALGVAADLLVAAGGTAVLAETSEIYGAEHLLTRRAITREVGEKLVERIKWWEEYCGKFGVVIDNNPSPGNKEGGLTTIYEKSLGAVAKGGSTALREVYKYAEPMRTKGMVVMDTPGYDPASITGMVAGGANMVCFTTGRGSCYGCKPVPSIKIATNTPMYERMVADMDVNAGVILSGASLGEVGQHIFDEILEVASGRKTKSEIHGVGEEEFVPWSVGPVL
ncbi:MAG: altronate dehydratase family protein [Planctomycetales bacterium]